MGFKPVKMKIAKISVKKEQGRQFLKEIGENSKFELEIIDLVKTANIDASTPSDLESQAIHLHDEFSGMKSLLDKMGLETKGRMNFESTTLNELADNAESLLEDTKPFMKKLQSIEILKEEISNFKQIITSLDEIKDLGIQNVQDLGEGSHFYAVLGFLKGIHQYRLEIALDQLTGVDFILNPVQAGTAKIICLVGVMKSYQAALDRLLSGLGFQVLKFPEELQGTPSEANEQAKVELAKNEKELHVLNQEIKETVDKNGLAIRAMEEQLSIEHQRLRVLQRTQQRKERYIIWAWLPGRQSKRLLKAIQQIDSSIRTEFLDPKLDPSEFPTKVRNNIYSRPFENLVHGFGTPGYKEWDPTKFLSILIPIFFGIMFADVFDGFVVLLLGLYGVSLKPSKYSKNAMLAEMQTYFDKGGPILCYIGTTAMIMGFLFGSYRGLAGHHALDVGLPVLWFSPEIGGGQFALLEIAIFIGSLVIGAALVLQFLNSWSHNKSEAIFLPGMFLLFYIGLIFLLFTFGPNPTLWFSATDGVFNLKALQTIAQFQEEYVLHHYNIVFISPVGAIFKNFGVDNWGIPVFAIPGINMSYPLVLMIFPLLLSSIYHFRHGMDGIGELLDYMITMISNTISFARIFAYTMVHGSLSLVFIQLVSGNAHTLLEFLPGMILGGFVVIPLELLVSFLQSLRLCWVEFFGKLHYQGSGYLFQPFKELRMFSSTKN
ncbi:MAG: V-type ATP synthase subunit I [Candidatus Hodarchaeales archaeon]